MSGKNNERIRIFLNPSRALVWRWRVATGLLVVLLALLASAPLLWWFDPVKWTGHQTEPVEIIAVRYARPTTRIGQGHLLKIQVKRGDGSLMWLRTLPGPRVHIGGWVWLEKGVHHRSGRTKFRVSGRQEVEAGG